MNVMGTALKLSRISPPVKKSRINRLVRIAKIQKYITFGKSANLEDRNLDGKSVYDLALEEDNHLYINYLKGRSEPYDSADAAR